VKAVGPRARPDQEGPGHPLGRDQTGKLELDARQLFTQVPGRGGLDEMIISLYAGGMTVRTSTSTSTSTTLMAWIGDAALSVLHDGQIPLSGGEQRILQLASIAEGSQLPARHPPRPGQPEPETPGHSQPSRRRTTPPVLASHHLSRLGRPPRPGLLTFTRNPL
jgi:hypothetical protein